MKINIIDAFLVLAFIFPIIIACMRTFNIKRVRREIKEVGKYFSLFLSILVTFYLVNNYPIVDKVISIFLVEFGKEMEEINALPYIVLIIVFAILSLAFYFIVKQLFRVIDFAILKPLMIILNENENRINPFIKKLLAIIFELPRSIFYVFMVAIIFNVIYRSDLLGIKWDRYITNSRSYELIKNVDLPKIVLKQELYPANDASVPTISSKKAKVGVINLYNGVTLDEGIKSNEDIDLFAKKVVKGMQTDKEKAKVIYEWIGENIQYDDDKAKLVEEQHKNLKSGAIPAYENKKGVCFDYACLYVAMCRAAGLKVKLVTGTAFNGKEWGPHAWNEVYLNKENKWINVDTTFYTAEGSFAGRNFDNTHKAEHIIGEWE